MTEIIADKATYTISEFAKLKKVAYSTVVGWIKKGHLPEAFQQGDGDITIKRWRVPKEALQKGDQKMTSLDFAQKMGVSYHTVMRWLRMGIVPGATKNRRDWEVPEEALSMEKPKAGPKTSGDSIVRTIAESKAVAELQALLKEERQERATLWAQHVELLEKYAALRGKYDKIIEVRKELPKEGA